MIITLHGRREREQAQQAIRDAPDLWRVEIREPRRSDDQNRRMWAMIDDVRTQKPDWFGPGLDADDVKQIFLSSLFKELRMARSADGDGFVPVGRRSSRLTVQQMSDLLSLIEAWCAREGVALREEERV